MWWKVSFKVLGHVWNHHHAYTDVRTVLTLGAYLVHCLSCLCSGAGEVLADSVLSLHSVKKLCIRDINPVPVLRILSQNVEHCAVSTLAIAFKDHPELVRSVSMGLCSTSQLVPLKAHLYTLCVHGCTQAHVAYPFVVHFCIMPSLVSVS